MRGAISKKRRSQPRWPEEVEGMETSKRARRRKRDTAKTDRKPPLAVLRRAGCPSRDGRNAPTLRQSRCQGFRLAYRDLSLRPKPFKCSANGFVHRDFGSISQFTGRLGAVQVLTRRHHCNGTGRYFRSRAVQVLVLKSLPCRNQLGCGQRNLLGFGSPCNRSDLCHELLHGQILSTNKIALTRMPILTDPYKPASGIPRIDHVPLSGDVTWKRTIRHLDNEAPRTVAGVVLAERHRWDTDDHRHSFRRFLSGQRILCPFHLQIGVLIVRSLWVTL